MNKKIEVSKLVKAQVGLNEQIKKSIENFQRNPYHNKFYLQLYIDQIQTIWNKFQTNHIAIYENEANNNADEYINGVLYETTEILFMKFISQCKEALEKLSPNNSPPPVDQSMFLNQSYPHVLKSDIKLPPISIPKFDGSYQSWRSFFDLFNSIIHKDANLTKVQKLHYLKSCVTGEAERLLHQFDITEANYQKAWEFLEKRYNNKRILVNTYLKKLLNQPQVKNESAQAIKQLLDQTLEIIHELNTLKIDTSTWDPILIYILTQKLPEETFYLWERELGGTTELPKYNQFIQFLETRFRTLEAIQTALAQQPQQCLKCKANHLLYFCKEFKALNISQKLALINKHKLCKNCFSSKHSVDKCPSKYSCFRRQQKHHTMLHVADNHQSTFQQSKNHETNSKHHTQPADSKPSSANNFLNNNSPRILLSTALVRAQDKHGNSIILRALIDSGSQV